MTTAIEVARLGASFPHARRIAATDIDAFLATHGWICEHSNGSKRWRHKKSSTTVSTITVADTDEPQATWKILDNIAYTHRRPVDDIAFDIAQTNRGVYHHTVLSTRSRTHGCAARPPGRTTAHRVLSEAVCVAEETSIAVIHNNLRRLGWQVRRQHQSGLVTWFKDHAATIQFFWPPATTHRVEVMVEALFAAARAEDRGVRDLIRDVADLHPASVIIPTDDHRGRARYGLFSSIADARKASYSPHGLASPLRFQ